MKAKDKFWWRGSWVLIPLHLLLFVFVILNLDHTDTLFGNTGEEGKKNEFISSSNSDFPQDWEEQNSGVHCNLRDICFVDSLYGWAVGDSGTVIATTDGGITWRRIREKVDSLEFKQIQFINKDVGYLGGNITQRFPYYVAYHVILLKTMNGGLSWESCDSTFDSSLSFGDMQFLDSENGWIGLKNIGQTSYDDRKGVLLKTNNGGQTWTVQQEKEELLIGAVAFWDETIGYSFWSYFFDNFDDTEVYYTSTGGSEWIQIGTIREDPVKKAKYFLPGNLWALGFQTSRSSDSGQTWDSWNWYNPVFEGQKRIVPKDVEVFDANTIWLVGGTFGSDSEGVLIFTNDSGATWWYGLQISDHSPINAISAVLGKEVWIAGNDGLIMHVNHIVTGIEEEKDAPPTSFALDQNYPNPFNSSTRIGYFLQASSHVHVEIFNILGGTTKTLVDSDEKDGWHEVIWDGRNESNESMPSGIYFYRVLFKGGVSVKKMMMVR